MEPSLPRTLDRYELVAVLGSGAFATVYRGRHAHTGQPVAVKVLGAAGVLAGDRWLAEARAMGALQHPNVVRVLDGGHAASGEIFLVMELSEGEPLRRWVRRLRPDAQRCIQIVIQLLDGLAAVHEKGIVHRDVKPANILIEDGEHHTPRLKLVDFGVSKIPTPVVGRTLPGMVMGTPGYMAPEMFGDAANADLRSDLYAAATILYELLAGHRPFPKEGYEELLVRVRTEPAPPLSNVAPWVPPEVGALVDRGLARDRHERWPSATAFADALRDALGTPATIAMGLPSVLPPDWPTEPPAFAKSNPPPPLEPTTSPVVPVALEPTPRPGRGRFAVAIVAALALVLGVVALRVARSHGKNAAHATAETAVTASVTAPPSVSALASAAPSATEASPAPSSDPLAANDVEDDPQPGAGSTITSDAGLPTATTDASAPTSTRARRGISFIPIGSVTNHVTDASLAAFGRAVSPRAQLCRPAGTASETVMIELLVNSGEIGIAHVPLGNKGDVIAAHCMASAFKELSDKGGRLSGDGIVQVLVILEPR